MPAIYLDNNATTRPAAQVVAAMRDMLETHWANPSSVHRPGQAARQRIELARQAVARLINARPGELVFTSGGTEADNLALRGTLLTPGRDRPAPLLITTAVEHSAVRQTAEELLAWGVRRVDLPVDAHGRTSAAHLSTALRAHAPAAGAVLVSIQWANNETGVLQPVEEIAAAVSDWRREAASAGPARVLLHIDAVQAVGKVPVDVRRLGVDLLSLAGHKFHGPKGVGALYIRPGVRLRAQATGGPQERQRRGGTENTAGLVGMGVAAELARQWLSEPRHLQAQASLRDRLEAGIRAALPAAVVHAAGAPRLWNTANIGFPRLSAEAILLGLSEQGLCASAGAACSSGSLEPSPVLLAMGVPEPVAHGSLRFSLSRDTGADEIEQAIELVKVVVGRLGQTLPV